MKIGIDIDDTITYSWSIFVHEYAKILNIPESTLLSEKPYYNNVIKTKYTVEEYFDKIRPINDILTPNLPLKENVKEVIDKLYLLGHKVIFITARGKETTNAYATTKAYLDKHNIKYEKLILAPNGKASECVKEKIDLFIDDSIKYCTAVSNEGIDVLMFETQYNKNCSDFKHVTNWNEIYEYIKSR